MKVIDQKDLNICYAHAASQLVEYHLRKKGEADRIHPAWLALIYSESKSKNRLEIGHTSEAMNLINGKSLCKSDIVSTQLQTISMGERSDIEIVSRVEKESENSVRFLSQLILPRCEGTKKIELPKVQRFGYRDLPTDLSFEEKLLSSLSKGSPLSISYCANLWTKKDYEGIGFNDLNLRDRLKKDCHYHESLVVGRKMIENSCHVLVRNTWGTEWRKSNKNWNCLCQNKMNGDLVDDCRFENQKELDVVACWLPSRELARNTGVITFLDSELPQSPQTPSSIASYP